MIIIIILSGAVISVVLLSGAVTPVALLSGTVMPVALSSATGPYVSGHFVGVVLRGRIDEAVTSGRFVLGRIVGSHSGRLIIIIIILSGAAMSVVLLSGAVRPVALLSGAVMPVALLSDRGPYVRGHFVGAILWGLFTGP